MVGWLLMGVIVIAPASAMAQKRDPTPSAHELWNEYPLHQEAATATPTATPTARAAGAEPSGRRASAPTGTSDGGGTPSLLFGVIGGVLVLGGFVVLRRRDVRRVLSSVRAARPAAPVLLAATVAAMAPDERRRSPRLTGLAMEPPDRREEPETSSDALQPPDPAQQWTAELEWQETGGGARFCLVARPSGRGTHALIAASEPLAWPPRDAAAVREMRNEVARMEAALLRSGWAPLAPGASWYSKRFTWAAVAEPVSTGRFERDLDWPSDTEELWRCEIKWKPGYVNSRFTVVTHQPGRRRRTTIGTSEPFKWLLMADADPQSAEQRAQVSALDERIVAAGWEPVDRGRMWCARRYVWRHEGPPPEQLEPAAAGTGEAHDGEH